MRLFSANKKRTTFLTRVILIVFVIYFLWSGRKETTSIVSSFYSDIDLEVNTSKYETDYSKYSKFKRKTKTKLDKANERVKKVFVHGRNPASLNKTEYLILTYTRVFDVPKLCGNVDLLEQCPFKNCRFTCNRNYARYADMVIFHAHDLLIEETETKVYLKSFLANLPSRKDQIWLLWHDEVFD